MSDSTWRQGLQLAAAVLLSYLTSTALRLPEGFWAVMSALIVVRPSTVSTLGAGWDRMRATAAGAGVGLGGVWLQDHFGFDSTAAVLGTIALLAAASAWRSSMRNVPIAALIVLSSGAMAGHSALQVAGLRVAQIAIGVASGVVVSLLGVQWNARARFDAACASALRKMAEHVVSDLGARTPPAHEKEAAAAELRLALRELAVQAASADREARFWRRLSRCWRELPQRSETARCVGLARLTIRTAHDAALLGRLADSATMGRDDPAWTSLAQAANRALSTTANSIEGHGPPELGLLRPFAAKVTLPAGELQAPLAPPIPWIAPAARLLMQDLTSLAGRAAC
ncbi:putative membrane protein [Variovorax sp. PBS-H4]|uniref:FUSC family protein n=1 Tax=Variovorax sp. PBS-H4 TaxID=434008 RepID=UPI00131811F9|nr:FUSC family protein [Variovorax sp. PBS-H4]VTU38137.1 putative membrane protein [Variovorax sp. PBS-H4]